MNTFTTDSSYLELDGDSIVLRPRRASLSPEPESPEGDYCGEWGAIVDKDGTPVGICIYDFFEFLTNHPFARATNGKRQNSSLFITLDDDRLPDIDGMPFLPVYRKVLPEGGDIFQLSGYDE